MSSKPFALHSKKAKIILKALSMLVNGTCANEWSMHQTLVNFLKRKKKLLKMTLFAASFQKHSKKSFNLIWRWKELVCCSRRFWEKNMLENRDYLGEKRRPFFLFGAIEAHCAFRASLVFSVFVSVWRAAARIKHLMSKRRKNHDSWRTFWTGDSVALFKNRTLVFSSLVDGNNCGFGDFCHINSRSMFGLLPLLQLQGKNSFLIFDPKVMKRFISWD